MMLGMLIAALILLSANSNLDLSLLRTHRSSRHSVERAASVQHGYPELTSENFPNTVKITSINFLCRVERASLNWILKRYVCNGVMDERQGVRNWSTRRLNEGYTRNGFAVIPERNSLSLDEHQPLTQIWSDPKTIATKLSPTQNLNKDKNDESNHFSQLQYELVQSSSNNPHIPPLFQKDLRQQDHLGRYRQHQEIAEENSSVSMLPLVNKNLPNLMDNSVGISVPEQDPDCIVPNAQEKTVRSPVWTSSYPGSGAKLTWKLIRAITGIFTSDDFDHNGRVAKGTVVAVKTHFPSHTPSEVFHKENLRRIDRAILLIRNPIYSIPSYHNFVYEQTKGLLNHSVRAPVEVWIKWRNSFFEQELAAWISHQKYWLDTYHAEKLYLIAMEDLTSIEHGPDELKKLGEFIAKGETDIEESLVPEERIDCIWNMFVNGRVPGEMERRKSRRSGGPASYPFTTQQIELIMQALTSLRDSYHFSSKLGVILESYINTANEVKQRIDQMVTI
jgi:hypothetical protein